MRLKTWRDMGIKKQKAKVDRYNKLCNSFPPISYSFPWFTYLVSQIAICSFNLHNSFTRITTPLFFIAWFFPSHWRIFHSYGEVIIQCIYGVMTLWTKFQFKCLIFLNIWHYSARTTSLWCSMNLLRKKKYWNWVRRY